jgi:glyceraldehyde 3-phosphate dehydrogenase
MPKPLRVAINGLGRIGRIFLRIAYSNPAFSFVAVNSRSDISAYAHLLQYDSIYGKWERKVGYQNDALIIDGKPIPFSREAEMEKLPWKTIQPDLVIESTGKHRKRQEAALHLAAGARYVLVTAPMKDPDGTFVLGVNEKQFNPEKHNVISAASCTSICASLVTKVLEEEFGIVHGFINTVHAFTSDQSLHDSPHKDLRRARAVTQSIIPTSTGVTETIGKLFPTLLGKMSGLAYRVPLIDPSVLSLTVELKKPVIREEINSAFSSASKKGLKGLLGVSGEPLVSVDHKQMPYGAVVDLLSTDVINGNFANVVAWYDNEWGYTNQIVMLLEHLGRKM